MTLLLDAQPANLQPILLLQQDGDIYLAFVFGFQENHACKNSI